MSGAKLAKKVGISQSQISKIETGLYFLSRSELTRILASLNVQKAVREKVLNQYSLLQTEFNSWKIEHEAGLAQKQFRIAELEKEAKFIRIFQMNVIPGLLQTPDYARCIMERNKSAVSHEKAEAVKARIERQIVLLDQTKNFDFLITESAIRHLSFPVKIILAQIDQVLNYISLPNVKIGVIPFINQLSLKTGNPYSSFCLFDSNAVTVETVTAELRLTNPLDVQRYDLLFHGISEVALCGNDAEKFLKNCKELIATHEPQSVGG